MKFAKADVPIFNRSVVMCTECSEAEAICFFQKWAKERANHTPFLVALNSSGWCQTNDGDVYLWARDKDRYSVELHEVVHAAFHLCSSVDAPPQEEMICRLVEFLKINLLDELVEHDEMTKDRFLLLLPKIREAAREHGYAVGLHGSLARDFDLIAVAWTEEAAHPEVVAEAIKIAAGGMDRWRVHPARPNAHPKPHGRLCYCFDFDKHDPNNRGYCDLSVVHPGFKEAT